MNIVDASFAGSATSYTQCPKPIRPEYAFIGRSNVGKSSLINMLTNRNGLAKTSQTPGKTQLINHFLINNSWFLVDLPGYGWAKTNKTKREDWDKMSREYLTKRENLMCVFVLIDSRLDAQKVDLEFMEWLAMAEVPFVIIFTKADKQSNTRTLSNIEKYQQTMLQTWEFMPQYFITSSEKKIGRDEVLGFIHTLNQEYKAQSKS
jgi:GTP-binding protein